MNLRNLNLLLLLCICIILSCEKSQPDSVYINGAPVVSDEEFSVLESISSGELIGTVTASDPDGEKLSFSITADESSLFDINAKGEIRLKAGAELDYESSSEHLIAVNVRDKTVGRNSLVKIKVENVIESMFELPESFITTWTVREEAKSITIGTDQNFEYSYVVDWGDGTIEELVEQNPTHEYASAGEYQVAIQGQFPAINMHNSDETSRASLSNINQWGKIQWRTMERAFMECVIMMITAEDAPDLSMVKSLAYMFAHAESVNADLSSWDVSQITDMAYMFANTTDFNGDLTAWDVSNVTDMTGVFDEADAFDKNLGNWKLTSVVSMANMLNNCGMSIDNFSNTLSGWYNYVKDGNGPNSIHLGAKNMVSCGIEAYMAAISLEENYNWTIEDANFKESCN